MKMSLAGRPGLGKKRKEWRVIQEICGKRKMETGDRHQILQKGDVMEKYKLGRSEGVRIDGFLRQELYGEGGLR